MLTEQTLITKYNMLPSTFRQELLDFLEFLLSKTTTASPVKKNIKRRKRVAGFAKGTFIMAPDFDEPLEDFKEYM